MKKTASANRNKKGQKQQKAQSKTGAFAPFVFGFISGVLTGVYYSLFLGSFAKTYTGIGVVIATVFGLVLAYGLWKRQKWGWTLTFLASIVLMFSLFTLNIINFAIGLVVSYYMRRRDTAEYFGVFHGQSAIEYLSTYGWAILIIAVVVSALYIFLSAPTNIAPNTCTFVSGAYCNDMIIGTNSVSGATKVSMFLTNSQDAPLENPEMYAALSNGNTSAFSCSPNYVLPGGAIICTIDVPEETAVGALLSGKLYLNATSCGLSANYESTHNCTSGSEQTYTGDFTGHTQPLTSLNSGLALAAANYTQTASGGGDPLTATVDLLGQPLKGATVNFTENDTSFRLAPKVTVTDVNGDALGSISGTSVGNVLVTASYAGLTSNVVIEFIAPLTVTFVPSNFQYCSGSGLTLYVDGNPYTCSQIMSERFTFPKGSVHTYSFVATVGVLSGIRESFEGLKINGIPFTSASGSITVENNMTIPFSYYVQYYLEESPNPSSGGTVSPGDNWYNVSTIVPISESPGADHNFNGWECTGSGCYSGVQQASTVIMDAPVIETANFNANTITVTFEAPPMPGAAGTILTVNGNSYTPSQLPVSVAFDAGSSSVAYAYAGTEPGSTGTQYTYSALSGCGQNSQSGTFTAPASSCSVSASYGTQYYLTMLANPGNGGTVSPSSGWYNSGSSASIGETEASGYTFSGWACTGTGCHSGTSASAPITIDNPISETASFTPPPSTYTITFAASSVSGSSDVLTVNGKAYAASSMPASLTLDAGSGVTYSYGGTVAGSTGTQYTYASLSGCGQSAQSGTFAVASSCTVTASYNTQYYLTTLSSPSTGGTASPASGWYNSGSSVGISESPSLGYTFTGWTGSGTGSYSGSAASTTITISSPVSETASFSLATSSVTFSISSSMPGSSGAVLTVDGTTYAPSSLPVTLSWTTGTSHSYSYSSVEGGGAGTQYTYSELSGCGQSAQSGTFTGPSSSCTISASYNTQYYLMMAAYPSSSGGTVSPGSGWYNSGSSVRVSEQPPPSGWLFSSWTGSGTGSYSGTSLTQTITMDNPISETANFNPYLTMLVSPAGAGTVTPASGAQPYGSQVTISDPANQGYVFTGWTGNGTGSYSGSAVSATVSMGNPITETATYSSATSTSTTSTSTTSTSTTSATSTTIAYVAFSLTAYSVSYPSECVHGTYRYISGNSVVSNGLSYGTTEIPQGSQVSITAVGVCFSNGCVGTDEQNGFTEWAGTGANSYTGAGENPPSFVVGPAGDLEQADYACGPVQSG
ncbi:MAG: InlB B-repeat-containing protein [Candidatus Micrarchaeaceae archaeon]